MEETLDMKTRIISVAGRLFVAGGYNGVSMRSIAEECGITKPALYYHYKNKDDLILAVILDCLEEYDHLLNSCLTSSTNTRQRLTNMIEALFKLSPEKRALIRIAGQEIGHLSPDSREIFSREYQRKFISKITSILKDGIQQKDIQALDPDLLTRIFLGILSPFFHLSGPKTRQAFELAIKVYFDGVSLDVK